MNFLFDNNGKSEVHFCNDWEHARRFAQENGLTLLGEFIGNV